MMHSIDGQDLIELIKGSGAEDYEVIMNVRHKYDVPASPDGWIAMINGVHIDHERKEVRLMN